MRSILYSGEKLIGTITHLTDGKLVFKSNTVGEATIAVKDIRSLTTDAPATLILARDAKAWKRLIVGIGKSF